MSGALAVLLSLSVKGALVAAAVAGVVAIGGHRLPPALRHGLWLLVFLRLLLPVAPPSPTSLLALSPSGGALLPGLEPALLATALEALEDGTWGAEPPASRTGDGPTAPWAVAAGAVWLLGLAALLARGTVRSIRLRRRLRLARPVTEERALRLLAEGRRTLGVRRQVAFLEIARLAGPAVVGLVRPRIVLPRGLAGRLDEGALRHVLLHELAHVRRYDTAVRAVAGLVTAVHWFNPAAWYALRRLDAECEIACDAAVLGRLPGTPQGRRNAYGHTLLEIAARPQPRMRHLGTATLALSDPRTLKRRIHMIARYRPVTFRRALAGGLLFAALSAATLTDAPLAAGPGPGAAAATAPAEEDAPGPAEIARARETLDRIREAGTAMYTWVDDTVVDDEWPTKGPGPLDWSACPPADHEEIQALLVPDYIAALPATDAWGHPLEFCLDRDPAPSAVYLAGVRSPGRDGVFEGDEYDAGSFPADHHDRDVLWLNGYFVTWPSRDAL